MSGRDAAALLRAYDAQLRGHVSDPLPDGVRVERDGPVLRFVGLAGGGMVECRELDGLIARQVRFFAERSEHFEWKLHGHDLPTDLPERLRAAGLVAEDVETVVIAPVAVGGGVRLPEGV